MILKSKLLIAGSAVLLLSAALLLFLAARPRTHIVSWYAADINGDSRDELLVITGGGKSMKLDSGQPYGDHLNIYSQYKIAGHRPILTAPPDYSFDLTSLKPLSVLAGDVNGDGLQEISICVYKTAKFHPVMAKRPFFYDLKNGGLTPVWLGSRLARPFEDYRLYDVDGDGTDELVSIELAEDGRRLAAVYRWKGFGFEAAYISGEINGPISFLNNTNRREDDIMVNVNGKTCKLELIDGNVVFSPNKR